MFTLIWEIIFSLISLLYLIYFEICFDFFLVGGVVTFDLKICFVLRIWICRSRLMGRFPWRFDLITSQCSLGKKKKSLLGFSPLVPLLTLCEQHNCSSQSSSKTILHFCFVWNLTWDNLAWNPSKGKRNTSHLSYASSPSAGSKLQDRLFFFFW